jgi:hypothetical protein
MSIATKQNGNSTDYKFGTGTEKIAQLSVDRSYTTQIEIVDGLGALQDIVYGGEEIKISATEFATAGNSIPDLGDSYTAGGATGYVTKATTLTSNEDVTKFQVEALGAPSLVDSQN